MENCRLPRKHNPELWIMQECTLSTQILVSNTIIQFKKKAKFLGQIADFMKGVK